MRVGVVGEGAVAADEATTDEAATSRGADAVADALDAAGARIVPGAPDAVFEADPAAVVAVGEPALLSVARRSPTIPVLPVAAGSGVRSVPLDSIGDAAASLVAGDWTTESHPLLSVDVAGDRRALALLDAMAVTAEPAHISEYTVAAEGELVARFRADGVAVATPAGTAGYARAAGGPVIPPGPSVLTVVPVAPFATALDHWVVPATDLAITVERDESDVDVLADDRTVGQAGVDDRITLGAEGRLETIRVPAGQSPFARS